MCLCTFSKMELEGLVCSDNTGPSFHCGDSTSIALSHTSSAAIITAAGTTKAPVACLQNCMPSGNQNWSRIIEESKEGQHLFRVVFGNQIIQKLFQRNDLIHRNL